MHVTSTEIQTSHDDEYFLGNSSVRDVGHQLFSTKPVEIQTDPIQNTMNDMNLQTDFGELGTFKKMNQVQAAQKSHDFRCTTIRGGS